MLYQLSYSAIKLYLIGPAAPDYPARQVDRV